MNHTATVLVLALGASDWGPITKTLTNRYSYRFIVAKSASEARNALQSAQIELAVSEEGAGSFEGMNFLLNLRTSNPGAERSQDTVAMLLEHSGNVWEHRSPARLVALLSLELV